MTDYGTKPNEGLFGPGSLFYFAWSRRPITLLVVHAAVLATPAVLALGGLGTGAWWALAPLTVLAMVIGYWEGMAWHRASLRNRWELQLLGDILHKYFGWDQAAWPAQALDGYVAGRQIIRRFAWLYSSSALGLVKGPNIIRMQWTNASGDTVCLLLGRTVEWWVNYGGGDHHALPDESGSWDIEFDPPRVLLDALKLVAP